MSLSPIIVTALFVTASLMAMGFHRVEEGYVGVYWRAGKLLDGITGPGMHIMYPLIDRIEMVQTTMQTDSVRDIPCGTSGGVLVTFGSDRGCEPAAYRACAGDDSAVRCGV